MGCFGGGSFLNTRKTATSRPAVENAGAFAPDKDEDALGFGILFIISAPSGSGKSTLVNELRNATRTACSFQSPTPRGPLEGLR